MFTLAWNALRVGKSVRANVRTAVQRSLVNNLKPAYTAVGWERGVNTLKKDYFYNTKFNI